MGKKRQTLMFVTSASTMHLPVRNQNSIEIHRTPWMGGVKSSGSTRLATARCVCPQKMEIEKQKPTSQIRQFKRETHSR
jgi:hypothetical protein